MVVSIGTVNILDGLLAPVGLNIGSITPDEIAFSIVGELIQSRRLKQREDVAEMPLTHTETGK